MVAKTTLECEGRKTLLKSNIIRVAIGIGILLAAFAAWRCSSAPAQAPTLASTATATLNLTGTPTSSRTPTQTTTRTNSPTLTPTKTLSLTATKAASVTPTATKTPTATATPKIRKVKVTWGGYANCHPKLEAWNESTAVRIPYGTVLEVVGEACAPVAWQGTTKVFKVKRPDGLGFCFIREPLVTEVR